MAGPFLLRSHHRAAEAKVAEPILQLLGVPAGDGMGNRFGCCLAGEQFEYALAVLRKALVDEEPAAVMSREEVGQARASL